MRLIDAEILLKKTILNPSHPPYITKSDVESMPTVDAAPVKHGEWVEEEEDLVNHWHCSECGSVWGLAHKAMKHCPNCGAKMDLEGLDDNS